MCSGYRPWSILDLANQALLVKFVFVVHFDDQRVQVNEAPYKCPGVSSV